LAEKGLNMSDEEKSFETVENRNANHNILYIDNPVGTGFSFTDQV
jgi:hypothetical protein